MSKKQIKTALAGVALIAVIAVLALAAKPEAEDDARLAQPVAKIDGEAMTLGYFESTAQRQSPLQRKELDDEAKRKEFLEKLINMELLAAEAARRGFDNHEEVQTVLKNQLASLMHRRIADEIQEVDPTEDTMRKYYDDHVDNYKKPEKMRARHILVSDKGKAEQLLSDVVKKKPSQYEFRRLAQKNSEDESTRLRGGDLTFFPPPGDRREGDPEVEPEVAEAAFKIKENGDVHPELVKSSKGYHVIMRTGHREKMDLTFDDAKERLVLLVKREERKNKVEGSIDALKEKFPVVLHEENLKDVVIDLSGGPPEPNAKGGLTAKERKEKREAVEKQREAAKKKKK
ncbi:MAG: peptidyl-prolyl cis-trans isomerase [Deltaproteobacteria bacterium]|nr:peptidyl-prolyl cis-trans isomerase [Deltaproteobacteria bacterium]